MATSGDSPSILHGPRLPYPDGELIDELVDKVAARRPEAVALRGSGGQLSYRELVAGAERVAGRLTAAGVRRGDVVAVRATRDAALMTVLLGVLKAGAAYACSPSEWPMGRYRQLVTQTGARVCVAPPDEAVEGTRRLGVADLLAPGGRAAPRPAGRSGTDPFCVFLTSGSTGRPKAALAPHRGVLRTALDPAHVLDGPTVSVQIASPAWDIFALELWVTLIRGGTCVLAGGVPVTGPAVREWVAAGATQLAMAATLFNALVDDDEECFAGLRTVLVGGERASADHFRRCLERHPGLRVVNAYGPVENTISTTTWVADRQRCSGELPIGRPVVNTSVYLLDGERRVIPVGQVGELATGGDGVSLGYLGDPAENERRFATVDVDGVPRRVYLTGDLAWVDEAGELRFAGRRDRQVKVRGLRIEAEEVERLIESVPGVSRAVVVALPVDAPVKDRLAAFWTADQEVPDELVRKTLTGTLPAGFVPDVLRPVPALPTLDTGKVDQRALAALAEEPAGTSAGEDEGDDVLGTLRRIARDLLGYSVGPDDDLFDRGATSLTAIRLATRAGRLLGRRLEVFDVLAARTPRRIAGVLATAPEPAGAGVELDQPGPERGYEPAGVPFMIRSFWGTAQHAGHLAEAIVPIVYRLSGPVDAAALARAVDHVVARHEVLRARFAEGGRLPRVRILPAAEVAGLLEVRPRTGAEEAVAEAAEFVTRPFDLAEQIPVRAAWWPVADDSSVLALCAHHIAFDGWSGQLFSRDLTQAYEAAAAGRPLPGGRQASYFRVCADQHERYREQRPLTIWQGMQKVRGVPELRFPLGGALPWTGPAAEVPLGIDRPLMAAVGRAAAAVQGTVMAIFYAAYLRLLRDYTGADEPAVAVPVTGRFTEEAGQVVGCLASMRVLRLPADVTEPAALAAAAADELRGAMRPPLVPMEAVMPELPEGYHRHPLLQAYLLQEEMAPWRTRFGPVDAELVRVPPTNALPEIAVELWPHPAVGGVLRYRTDAIPPQDASRLADRLVRNVMDIVAALGAAPEED